MILDIADYDSFKINDTKYDLKTDILQDTTIEIYK